jgi:protein involved in polysaccharide export with SLBB domain
LKSLFNLILGTLFTFVLFSSITYGQSEEQLAKQAAAMDINTRQQALDELAKRGISENQARQMARMRGIDFDAFLNNYLGNQESTPSQGLNPSMPQTQNPTQIGLDTTTLADEVIMDVRSVGTTKSDSTYFGYSIFDNNPYLSKDYLVGNIDEGYLISPGDRLRIVIFGDNSLEVEAEVDLNGNITIPNFGVFQAAGNTYGTLRDRLTVYFGKYFSGLLSARQTTFLDVSLTQIRPVKITVVGESNAPGAHLVSGMASVLTALYTSGGIKTSGSLRSIKVYRNNQLYREVDLYDFLTSGSLNEDFRLTSNDLIFIPPRQSTVTLQGEVKKPAIYELKPGETLQDLIRFSGGLPVNTSRETVTIQRIKSDMERNGQDIYDRFLTSANFQVASEYQLQDGDVVRFFPILEKVLNQVTLSGNVNQPGDYPISEFPDLKSLILNAGKNIRPNTYLGKVDVYKENLNGKRSFTTYNLQSVLNNSLPIQLESQDSVKVYSLQEVQGEKLVYISGFGLDSSDSLMSNPSQNVGSLDSKGRKSLFWRENLSLFDLIFQSTSFEELDYQSKLLTSRIDLKRFDAESGIFQVNTYSLDKLAELQETYLQPKDEVILYSKEVTEVINPTVRVTGYVREPMEIPLTAGMSVEDAILQAGGFLEYADQDLVVVNRERFDYNTGQLSQRFDIIPDSDYLLGNTNSSNTNFVLENNDIISVRKQEGVEPLRSISIDGAVRFPGSIVLEERFETFSALADKVGGLRDDAYLPASYVIRNGNVLAVNLSKSGNLQQSFFQDGDQIFIADRAGTVEVLGAVENEVNFVWKEGKKAKFYLRNAGGKVRKEGGKAFLIQPNGLSSKIGLFKNPTVLPDSRILVNRKPPKEKSEKPFIDTFIQILSVTTGALTTIILVQNLNN